MYCFTHDEKELEKDGWFKVTAEKAKPGDILYLRGIDVIDDAFFEHTVMKIENGLIYSRENCEVQFIPPAERGVHKSEYLWRSDNTKKHGMPAKCKHLLEVY